MLGFKFFPKFSCFCSCCHWKTKSDTTNVLISKVLINFYINRDEFVSANYVLREYDEMKENAENPERYCNPKF